MGWLGKKENEWASRQGELTPQNIPAQAKGRRLEWDTGLNSFRLRNETYRPVETDPIAKAHNTYPPQSHP